MVVDRESEPGATFSFLGDLPSCDGADPLGFEEVADELAQLILRSGASTPYALGIEGAWGTGKSTLMERLRRRLAADPRVATATFNAWTAADGEVVEGLVKTVLDALDPSAMRRALRNAHLVTGARVAVNVVASWLKLGSVVDLFWSKTAIDPQTRNQMIGLVERAVSTWARRNAGVPGGRLLCVVVDDLDRCSPRTAMAVLEGIKLYVNVPGIVFVIGYDQTIVSDLVLQERGYSEAIKGRDYLEKFIQIKYRIPRPSSERSMQLIRSLLEASGTSALFGEDELTLLVDRNARNPRRIKRFLNDFVLAYGMDPAWRDFEPASLIRLQLLNAYFEELARLLAVQEDPDPLQELEDYREARELLRRVEVPTADVMLDRPRAFERYGLPFPGTLAPGDPERLLGQLEDEVPVGFPRLVEDRELLSLVDSLRGADDWPQLRRRLLETEVPVEPDLERDLGRDARRLDGLSVLWVDDQHAPNAPLVEVLQRLGADVELADDTSTARAALERRRFDVLVSDIQRGIDHSAGIDALAAFRAEGIAPADVVFYTARVTGARAAAAQELGARVVTVPDELIEQLAEICNRVPTRSRPFVIDVVGLPGDEAMVEHVCHEIAAAGGGALLIRRTAVGVVPNGDALLMVVGEAWGSMLARSERSAMLDLVRMFAATGAPLQFVRTSGGPREAVREVAAAAGVSAPIVHEIDESNWESGLTRLAVALREHVTSSRPRRGMPS